VDTVADPPLDPAACGERGERCCTLDDGIPPELTGANARRMD
jgi:hypothetical protein